MDFALIPFDVFSIETLCALKTVSRSIAERAEDILNSKGRDKYKELFNYIQRLPQSYSQNQKLRVIQGNPYHVN